MLCFVVLCGVVSRVLLTGCVMLLLLCFSVLCSSFLWCDVLCYCKSSVIIEVICVVLRFVSYGRVVLCWYVMLCSAVTYFAAVLCSVACFVFFRQ